jgi:hypothetical protein
VEWRPVARRVAKFASAITTYYRANTMMRERREARVMFAKLRARSVCRGVARRGLPGGIVGMRRRVRLLARVRRVVGASANCSIVVSGPSRTIHGDDGEDGEEKNGLPQSRNRGQANCLASA